MTICVCGSINADRILHIDQVPTVGATVAAKNLTVGPGGKGANQAVAAARAGAPVAFIGQHGDDEAGDLLRHAIMAEGIDCRGLRQVTGPSGQAMILLQDDGDNAIVVHGGANTTWTGLDPEQAAIIAGSRALLLQREIPLNIITQAATIAREAGVPVILDAGGSLTPVATDLLALVDLFSPNRSELAACLDRELPDDEDDLIEQATEWCDSVANATGRMPDLLLKNGAAGSCYIHRDAAGHFERIHRQPALKVPVRDTTGAGDCFTATYLVARTIEGLPIDDAMRFASAAAALCIGRDGALPSMPHRADIDALL